MTNTRTENEPNRRTEEDVKKKKGGGGALMVGRESKAKYEDME